MIRKRLMTVHATVPTRPAYLFAPHHPTPTVSLLGVSPYVLIEPLAFSQMYHIVDLADQEVGWLGTCDRDGDSFVISEVFLTDQVVGSAENTLTTEGLSALARRLIAERGNDAYAVLNRIRFWGHSHGSGGTSPSPQDDQTVMEHADCGHDFFVRGILNRNGSMRFSIFFYTLGIKIDDVPWSIALPNDSELRSEIERQFAERVTAEQPSTETVSVAVAVVGENEVGEPVANRYVAGDKDPEATRQLTEEAWLEHQARHDELVARADAYRQVFQSKSANGNGADDGGMHD